MESFCVDILVFLVIPFDVDHREDLLFEGTVVFIPDTCTSQNTWKLYIVPHPRLSHAEGQKIRFAAATKIKSEDAHRYIPQID